MPTLAGALTGASADVLLHPERLQLVRDGVAVPNAWRSRLTWCRELRRGKVAVWDPRTSHAILPAEGGSRGDWPGDEDRGTWLGSLRSVRSSRPTPMKP